MQAQRSRFLVTQVESLDKQRRAMCMKACSLTSPLCTLIRVHVQATTPSRKGYSCNCWRRVTNNHSPPKRQINPHGRCQDRSRFEWTLPVPVLYTRFRRSRGAVSIWATIREPVTVSPVVDQAEPSQPVHLCSSAEQQQR